MGSLKRLVRSRQLQQSKVAAPGCRTYRLPSLAAEVFGFGCGVWDLRSKTNRVLEIIAQPAVIGITFRGLKLEDEALVLVNRGIAKINYILSSMLEVEAAIEDHKTPKDEPYSAHLHSKF